MLLLLPLALWGKAIAYGLWRQVHKIFALVLVAGVLHSALLMPLELWASPVGAATALALSVASVAALLSLTGRIGARRTVRGELVAAQRLNPSHDRTALPPRGRLALPLARAVRPRPFTPRRLAFAKSPGS